MKVIGKSLQTSQPLWYDTRNTLGTSSSLSDDDDDDEYDDDDAVVKEILGGVRERGDFDLCQDLFNSLRQKHYPFKNMRSDSFET